MPATRPTTCSTSRVREYYQILKDTLIAHEVPALTDSRKRKAISTSKYYLFDIGLARHLQGRRGLAPGTSEYGAAFETDDDANSGAIQAGARPSATSMISRTSR